MITKTNTHPEPSRLVKSAIGERCFYCGHIIHSDPAICWSGFTSIAFWHPDCVIENVTGLMIDVRAAWRARRGE